MNNLNLFLEVVPAVLTVVGITGNSLNLYILSRPEFLKESIFRYFILNEIICSINLVLLWAHYTPVILEIEVSNIYCKFVPFIIRVFYYYYPWINVVNSVDRLLLLIYPQRLQFRNKFKFQALIVGLILCVIIIFSNVTSIVYGTRNFSNDTLLCIINDRLIGIYISGTNFMLSNLVASCIIILVTCKIAHYLFRKKKLIQQNRRIYKREIEFVKNIFTMDFWFIISYTPFTIVLLMQNILDPSVFITNTWKILSNTFILLAVVHISCNFFVFLLCNKRFRKYFKSMFSKNHVTPL